jgi:trk system potassium uptake protein
MPARIGPIKYRTKKRGFFLTPVQSLVLGFAILIFTGSALLMLPESRTGVAPVYYIDALFTSTSAVCVTGLTSVDTATIWTRLGQVVILLLIQFGGIGIIAFGALFALVLGQKFTFRQRALLREQYGELSTVNVASFFSVVRAVVLVTVTLELVAAILLWPMFAPRVGTSEAAFFAIFHSISAFCNAGFSTFTENLEGYQGHWGVNIIICALIVLGGLGFPVHAELLDRMRTRKKISLHTKTVLWMTSILIVGGMLFLFIFENLTHGEFQSLPVQNKFLVCLFQSVTARTAGFDTIPMSYLGPASLVLINVLMFIGGSPAGTAGGVKTTTFATAIVACRSILIGKSDITLFDRRLSVNTVRRAVVLILLALLLLTVALMILLLSGPGETLQLTFEAVSAFGTVGLSTGITSHLTTLQKIVIILLMFIGRVGPLAFVLSFARTRAGKIKFAETDLLTG